MNSLVSNILLSGIFISFFVIGTAYALVALSSAGVKKDTGLKGKITYWGGISFTILVVLIVIVILGIGFVRAVG